MEIFEGLHPLVSMQAFVSIYVARCTVSVCRKVGFYLHLAGTYSKHHKSVLSKVGLPCLVSGSN